MEKRRSNRRQFLQGVSARDAIEDFADGAGADDSAAGMSSVTKNPVLLQLTRRAMACQFEVLLNRPGASGLINEAPDCALQALDLVEELEDQLTVYRDHSEVSRINRYAHESPVVVEEGLFRLLQRAKALHEKTEGAFDITAGPLVKAWGFFRRQGAIPGQEELDRALDMTGSEWIELDSMRRTIQLGKPGVEINLGAIGKGYALDRCAELLAYHEVDSFLLHGGMSSVLARGGRDGSSKGWTVGLRHPQRADQRIAEIYLRDAALGTSGTAAQFFHYQGKRYGHVIDPRTGWPIDSVLSATAIGPSAAGADALATAFFVLGVEGTTKFCLQNPETAALIVTSGKRTGDVELHPINLPDEHWRETSSAPEGGR